ncbi:hypothetical protein PanWU01x14_232770 [Parasponia andersonii]|uniref:Uncharacterized protein n=1 Tax=Parasponia andersonii TaxID=3476 RepID=A0A2P5BJQ7_PARAD|nr:hypothetical protein PanWU01x14_232770 [Parasponia andersonii]
MEQCHIKAKTVRRIIAVAVGPTCMPVFPWEKCRHVPLAQHRQTARYTQANRKTSYQHLISQVSRKKKTKEKNQEKKKKKKKKRHQTKQKKNSFHSFSHNSRFHSCIPHTSSICKLYVLLKCKRTPRNIH